MKALACTERLDARTASLVVKKLWVDFLDETYSKHQKKESN